MSSSTHITTATLYFTPLSGAPVTINPITGRPSAPTTGVEESIEVSLEQRDVQGRVIEIGGRDMSGLYCTGRVSDKNATIPRWLRSDNECRIVWANGETGYLYLLNQTPSRYGLESVFGYRITGLFRSKSIKSQ